MKQCKYCINKDENGTYLKGKCNCEQLPTTTICVRNDGQECPFYIEETDKNKKRFISNKRMHTKMKRSWNEIKNQLIKAKEQNLKESCVEDICKEVLINILGYEKSNIENQYSKMFKDSADFIIKDSNKIIWIVECKRTSEDINKRKWIEQIEKYHLEFHTNWAILTNGLKWAIYYLEDKKDSVISYKVYEINDFSELSNCKNDREKFYPFTNVAIKKGIREKLLNKTIALSDEIFYKAIISKDILKNISRILHTKLNVKVEIEEIKNKIKEICPNLPEDIQGFRK